MSACLSRRLGSWGLKTNRPDRHAGGFEEKPRHAASKQVGRWMMKTQQVMIALTLANAGMLLFSLARPRHAAAQDAAPLLRARALEIVDDQGRVRAEIKVFPAQPALKMPDGTTGYP